MQVRVALWWVALAAAIGGLVYFLFAEVALPRYSYGKHSVEVVTGAELLGRGLAELVDGVHTVLRSLRFRHLRPRPVEWLTAGTVIAVLVPLVLRLRPSRRARWLLGGLTLAVSVPMLAVLVSLQQSHYVLPSTSMWIWLGAIVAMCATPWLRRHDQLVAVAAWEARPAKPVGELGKLDNLPPDLASLVRCTRNVRCSLDVLDGMDSETLRVLWDWQRRVEDCRAEDAALLRELGLTTAPVTDTLCAEGRSDTEALLEIDKTLSTFESTLANYRSFGFR